MIEVPLSLDRRLWGVVFLLGGLGTPAFARIHLPGEPQARPKAPEPAPVDDSVAAVSVRAGYFGAVLLGVGAGADWRVDDWELGLAGYGGTADLTGTLGDQVTTDSHLADYKVDNLSLSATLITVEARYFFGDNFTVTTGLGWRELKGHVRLSDPAGETLSADAAMRNLVATLAVGSVWAWDNGFFLGIDWIGVAWPLTSAWNVETRGSAPATHDLKDQADKLAQTLSRSPALILLLGAAGWRF
jgi:hypothetical protein